MWLRWKSNNSSPWSVLNLIKVGLFVARHNPAYFGGFITRSRSLHQSSSLSHPPFYFPFSALLLSCLSFSGIIVSKGRLLGPAMKGLCCATEINAPQGNDSSCSRLPGGLCAHPGSQWACARWDRTMEIYLSASPYARCLIRGLNAGVKE